MATDLEIFRAITRHENPGRILYYGSFTPDLERRVKEHIGTDDIAGHYGFWKVTGINTVPPEGHQPPDYSGYWEGEDLPEGTTINDSGVAMVPSGFYHFFGYISPLRNAQDISEIENYPLADVSTFDTSQLKATAEKAHQEGRIVSGWVGHMYETAWQIRGYEQFLMDMALQPSWAECLLERLFQRNMIKARAFAEAGADMIQCGDDVCNQRALTFAPDMWRSMILARWSKVWKVIKDINPDCQIWYHSDGNVAQIVPEMIDAGMDILNPVQPECTDADALKKQFGSRLTFDGTIGTQSTMPWGKPEDVRARVREVIDKYGRNGGLIISPTHVMEPEVPLENIDALFDECRKFRNE